MTGATPVDTTFELGMLVFETTLGLPNSHIHMICNGFRSVLNEASL